MARDRRHRSNAAYSRMDRINALLQEVLADELSRAAVSTEELSLMTITGVVCEPDLRRAVVYFASLAPETEELLAEHRRALQSAVATQLRIRRVPLLSFAVDPAIEAGARVEDALRRARDPNATPPA